MKQKKLKKLARLSVKLLNETCKDYQGDCPQCPFGGKGASLCLVGAFGNSALRVINNGKQSRILERAFSTVRKCHAL